MDISLSAEKRKITEKILAADETTMYSLVKLSWPYEVRKSNTEQGDSKASTKIQRTSAVFMGASRNGFPLRQIRRFAITSKARKMHRGAARYHRDSIFLASRRKSTEPKKEIMLSNSITAMKNRSGAGKSDIEGSGIVTGIKRNKTDKKPVTHAIRKTADVKARAIFIFINRHHKCKATQV